MTPMCLTINSYFAGTPGGIRSFVSLRSLQRRRLLRYRSVRLFESREHAPMACSHFMTPMCLTINSYFTGTPGGIRSFVSLRSLQRRRLLRYRSVRLFESREHAPMACSHFMTPMCLTVNSYFTGTPGGIRTPNLRIRSPLLYPIELQARTQYILIDLYFFIIRKFKDINVFKCEQLYLAFWLSRSSPSVIP